MDLQGAAGPMEVEGELPNTNAEEMAKEGFYLLKSVIRYHYRQGCVSSPSGRGLELKKLPGNPSLPLLFLRDA